MCGIVGFVGYRPAARVLIQGLKYLEYRGYDSTGIALLVDDKIDIHKSQGRIENTQKLIEADPGLALESTCGIGHTRWATHGKPSTENAHPHKTGHIVLAHNGIIENFLDLKRQILAKNYRPLSETDSELIGFLLLDTMESGLSLELAVRKVSTQLKGQWSIVVMSEREPGRVIGVRQGSPLVASMDAEGNTMIASDAQPLLPFTREVVFLEHGDMAVGTRGSLNFFKIDTGEKATRSATKLDWTLDKFEKMGFPHYMLKEIFEQPSVIRQTLRALLGESKNENLCLADAKTLRLISEAKSLVLVACGTSWHAGLLGKYWLEKLAKLPVHLEYASEYRYRDPHIASDALVIGISQSGETADTLVVIREMQKRSIPTLAITNVHGSTLAREADAVLYTQAGPEIGVAATKTFMAQILTLFVFATTLAHTRGETIDISRYHADLFHLSETLSTVLNSHSQIIEQLTDTLHELADIRGFFFIGRGYSYPLALEAALKWKEVSYEHAEAHAAGELKHGPIAMLDESIAVIALVPQDDWHQKNLSNLQEVKARGAKIIGIGGHDDDELKSICWKWISLPEGSRSIHPDLIPFVLTPYIQLLSYIRGVQLGKDVDKPRNLAKSVTVE